MDHGYRDLCDTTQMLADGAYQELFLDWTKAEDVCFDYGMTYLLAGDLEQSARMFETTANYPSRSSPHGLGVFLPRFRSFSVSPRGFAGFLELGLGPKLVTIKEVVSMRFTLGLILVVLGVVVFVVKGISYTTEEEVLDVGPLEVSKQTEETIPLSPILGGAALLGGVALVGTGRK